MRKLAPLAHYRPEQACNPLAEINRRLQIVMKDVRADEHFPRDPNWIARLQDLLEDRRIDIDAFADVSRKLGGCPAFNVRNRRLHIDRVGVANIANADNILMIIKAIP